MTHNLPKDRALSIPLKNPKITRLNKLQRVTHEDMARLIGYKMVEEWNTGDLWGHVYREAKGECEDDEDAQARADEACHKEEDRLATAEMDSIEAACEHMLNDHGLTLQKLVKKPWTFLIVPADNTKWKHPAQCIRGTINGVGLFQFDTIKEFLDSGPYTARQAVLEHLHWMKDYPRVYGDLPYARRVRFE